MSCLPLPFRGSRQRTAIMLSLTLWHESPTYPYIHVKDAIMLPDGKTQTTYCGEGHAYVPEITSRI